MNTLTHKLAPRSIVTGGAGFLGSHLVDELIARNHEVVVVDDLSTGHVHNLANALESGRATFVYGDVTTVGTTIAASLEAMNAPRLDYVFHLASPASPEAYGAHPWETLRANAIGTMDFIELALHHRATFVYASTSEVYGDPLVNPQPETYFGNVDPIGPRSCYDEGKRFGEAAVAAAARARGLDARVVRFFNCYGPRMEAGDGRLIPALVDAAIASRPVPDPRQRRADAFAHLRRRRDRRDPDRPHARPRVAPVQCRLRRRALQRSRHRARGGGNDGRPIRHRARRSTGRRIRSGGDPELTAIRALGLATREPHSARGLARTCEWFVSARHALRMRSLDVLCRRFVRPRCSAPERIAAVLEQMLARLSVANTSAPALTVSVGPTDVCWTVTVESDPPGRLNVGRKRPPRADLPGRRSRRSLRPSPPRTARDRCAVPWWHATRKRWRCAAATGASCSC